jgi:hypothetical protein
MRLNFVYKCTAILGHIVSTLGGPILITLQEVKTLSLISDLRLWHRYSDSKIWNENQCRQEEGIPDSVPQGELSLELEVFHNRATRNQT